MQGELRYVIEQELNKDKEDFKIIKEYIRNNPTSNAMEIANTTGISINKIIKFIQQGAILMKF